MPLKTTIYLSDESLAVLERRGNDDASRSAIIARVLDRYSELCRRELPELEVSEWKLIVDSLNGTTFEHAGQASWFRAEVEDSIRINKLDEKWEVAGKPLLRKLGKLSYAQCVAVIDCAEQWWVAVGRGDDPKVPGE